MRVVTTAFCGSIGLPTCSESSIRPEKPRPPRLVFEKRGFLPRKDGNPGCAIPAHHGAWRRPVTVVLRLPENAEEVAARADCPRVGRSIQMPVAPDRD